MKKLVLLSSSLFLMFALSNCKKDETAPATTTTPATTTPTVTAGAEELHMKSSGNDLLFKKGKGDLTSGSFSYQGIGPNGETLNFSIDTLSGVVGEYAFAYTSAKRSMTLKVGGSYYSTMGIEAGSVKVTGINRTTQTISGTFSLNLADSKGLKTSFEGAFNIIYVKGGRVSAKINGAVAKVFSGSISTNNTSINITGKVTNSFESIYLNFPASITPGTYTYGPASSPSAAYGGASFTAYYAGQSGTITITQYDKLTNSMKGTFSFVGKSNADGTTVTISEGSFDVQGN
jgi:hypothetical protein